MNYQETVQYLFSYLPMYSRIGSAAYKNDLTNTLQLCALLNNPENKFRSIHIAGTNGKGSTSHMLAAVLQHCGYKTGLYTSPHLKDFRERIRLNGEMIPEERVMKFVADHREAVEKIGCSFFEWTVGLAFQFFAEEKVDVAVIETGLGGRLDSTNVISPTLSIITNISFDHTEMLGNTLEKIAFEKAGIIKRNVPVVIGECNPDTGLSSKDPNKLKEIFLDRSIGMNAPISFANENWNLISSNQNVESQSLSLTNFKNEVWNLELDLRGEYQKKNAITVLESCRILNSIEFDLKKEKIIDALRRVKSLTHLHGRWDVLQKNPMVIADVAHNEAGLSLAIQQLLSYSFSTLHFVIGFVKEKNPDRILPLFPKNAHYYFCRPNIPRGLDENDLAHQANEIGLNGEKYISVIEAYHAALHAATPGDLIYVGGSTFVVAEII